MPISFSPALNPAQCSCSLYQPLVPLWTRDFTLQLCVKRCKCVLSLMFGKMELDSEQIILAVEKYACLYDLGSPEYKNRHFKRASWILVTEAVVGEKWEEMDEQEKNDAGKEVMKRWKSMKDSFMKSLKKQEGKSRDPTKRKKPYVFYKQMSFLQSNYQPRGTSGNMITAEPIQIIQLQDNDESNSAAFPMIDQPAVKVSRQQKRRKSAEDDFERESVTAHKVNMEQSQIYKPFSPDPDEMFFLSQLPLIKNLSSSNKLDFQIKFMQLVQSYSQAPISNTTTRHPRGKFATFPSMSSHSV